jgi:hypothetical protein
MLTMHCAACCVQLAAHSLLCTSWRSCTLLEKLQRWAWTRDSPLIEGTAAVLMSGSLPCLLFKEWWHWFEPALRSQHLTLPFLFTQVAVAVVGSVRDVL